MALEIEDLKPPSFDLALTGFDPPELDRLQFGDADQQEDELAPEPPAIAASQLGDLYVCGSHRVLCGDATLQDAVSRLLGDRKPIALITDPPYGIGLDLEWRDDAAQTSVAASQRRHLKRIEGHRNTSMLSDTRAEWSDAFALVPSLQVGYVWHASKYTREVLDGLLRIGFVHYQQIIWSKGRAVFTRSPYWFAHEPCWFVRKKNAPWYGKAGENSTIWDSPSPKFIVGGSHEDKFDHPTQKPIALMRRPILNHTRGGELVYDPFLGSGTTLAACEETGRDCYGLEIDPRYVDVLVTRWQKLTGKQATLESDGRTFDQITAERRPALGEA